MKIVWSRNGWEDYQFWIKTDHQILTRANTLIEEMMRHPFKGTGKPEPLKGELRGWWSRRLNGEDRIVYRGVGKKNEQVLEIIQCRGHY